MKWVVRKSKYPVDPSRPWYAASKLDAAMGLGHPFPSRDQACAYVRDRLTPPRKRRRVSIGPLPLRKW